MKEKVYGTPLCSLCLRKVESNKKIKVSDDGLYLCRVCKRRYIIDKDGFIRKKRSRKSPSKLQRHVRLLLLEIFNKSEVWEDVYFAWNKSPKTSSLLQYDFYIADFNLVIEVQGQHHYKCVGKFRMNSKDLERIKLNDRVKKKKAEENGLCLYYIKYDDDLRDSIIRIYNDVVRRNK